MRNVKKATIDDLARVTRKYKATGDTDLMAAKFARADELAAQAFGNNTATKWLAFTEIVDGVFSLNQNTSNDTIYKIFGLLGIDVSTPIEAETDAN